MTVAADIDQKPPMTTPSRARPAMSIAKLGANATKRPDANMRAVNESSRVRRSMPRVIVEMERLVSTANRPDTEIACPAAPSVRWRSDAIGVRMLTGMNSEAISVETHSASASTAPHPVRSELRSAAEVRGLLRIACSVTCSLRAMICARNIGRDAAGDYPDPMRWSIELRSSISRTHMARAAAFP
jgi:hypothetical protein